MWLFIVLCLGLLFLGVWTVSKKNISRNLAVRIYVFVSFCWLLSLAGLRGLDVGSDTPMYVRYFYCLRGLTSLNLYSNRFEIGYRLLNCLVAQFFSNPHVLLFVAAFLTLALMYKAFLRASVLPVYSILLFLGYAQYYSVLTMMRQFIAIALCANAILFLNEKKRIWFIILTTAACLFHKSAVVVFVMLILSILPYKKKKRHYYFLVGIALAFGLRFIMPVIVSFIPEYSGYLYGDRYYLSWKLGSLIKVFLYGTSFIICDFLYGLYGEDNEINKISFFTGYLGFFITLFSLQGAVMSRIAMYFNIMFCISIPNALSSIPNRKNKYFLAVLVLIGVYTYNIILLIFRPYWSGIIPYTFLD